MSLLGHFRPIQSGFAMSAYPPIPLKNSLVETVKAH
jgi:hypothetical protein